LQQIEANLRKLGINPTAKIEPIKKQAKNERQKTKSQIWQENKLKEIESGKVQTKIQEQPLTKIRSCFERVRSCSEKLRSCC